MLRCRDGTPLAQFRNFVGFTFNRLRDRHQLEKYLLVAKSLKIWLNLLNVNSGVRDQGRSSSKEQQSVHLWLLQQRCRFQGRKAVLTAISATLPAQRQLPVLLLRSAAREDQGYVRQRWVGSDHRQVGEMKLKHSVKLCVVCRETQLSFTKTLF